MICISIYIFLNQLRLFLDQFCYDMIKDNTSMCVLWKKTSSLFESYIWNAYKNDTDLFRMRHSLSS